MMMVRSTKEVCRHVVKASAATLGISSSSDALTPLRDKMGLLVVGEIVVMVSTDMFTFDGIQ